MDEPFAEFKEAKKRVGFFRVFEVLYCPSSTFRHIIDAGHVWLYPAILLAVILEMGIIMDIPYMREQISEPALLLPEGGMISEGILIIAIVLISIFALPIGFSVAYIVPSLIYIFIGNFVFEGKAGFRQVLNITAYASMPYIFGRFVENMLSGIMGTGVLAFSPAVFFPVEMQTTFLGIWLGLFNPFLIWQIALTIIGLSALYNHTRAKTAAWLIPLYLAVYSFFAVVYSFMDKLVAGQGLP